MRESRLFKIVYYLLEKGSATAGELAEKNEVSVRTIYRDLDALSAAGIPVYTETGRNGGIRLMDDFVLERAALSEREKQDILTALQSVSAASYIRNEDILGKLSALFQTAPENWLEVDFARWGSRQGDNIKFEQLKSAVICHKCVKICYAGSDGTTADRVIHPLKLLYKSREWYVKSFCTEKQAFRLFKLSRILELEVLDEKFTPRAFPEAVNASEPEYRQIVLRFPKEMAYRVYDEFDTEYVDRQKNGEMTVSAQIPEDAWLMGFLLSCGEQVEIIEPADLRETVAELARRICEKYKI